MAGAHIARHNAGGAVRGPNHRGLAKRARPTAGSALHPFGVLAPKAEAGSDVAAPAICLFGGHSRYRNCNLKNSEIVTNITEIEFMND
jgi:hypothetical protein